MLWNILCRNVVLDRIEEVSDCPECANGMRHEECRDGWRGALVRATEEMEIEGHLLFVPL